RPDRVGLIDRALVDRNLGLLRGRRLLRGSARRRDGDIGHGTLLGTVADEMSALLSLWLALVSGDELTRYLLRNLHLLGEGWIVRRGAHGAGLLGGFTRHGISPRPG